MLPIEFVHTSARFFFLTLLQKKNSLYTIPVSKGSLSEPVSTHLSYDSPLAHDSSLGFTPSLPLPLHLPPSTTSQFSSLPTDVLTMNNTYHIEDITPPAATTTLFHSLTSTSNTGTNTLYMYVYAVSLLV